jgi:hypothetical protein
MPYETFDLRFESCGYALRIPLHHNSDNDRCFVCGPELREVPASGKCPVCISAQQQGEKSEPDPLAKGQNPLRSRSATP